MDLVASRGIPVIAAGGIVDERGYVAALALGAQVFCLGTRWIGAPQRVLKTTFYMEWRNLPSHENEANQHVIGHTTRHGMGKEIRQFAGTMPNKTTKGDIESMVMYAGEGVGLIHEILPASQVVNRLVEGAQILIQQHKSSTGIY
ncbi:unnamed protein product [Lactuca virosa]|uniref:Nitronate monooxygenase domain-containing protein n=1 Tax=Lactuca virosa TaxID=75947 RepID=A0AAU9NQ44_9ASTR|nr:unnamed protein product [Lactuca virosa]